MAAQLIRSACLTFAIALRALLALSLGVLTTNAAAANKTITLGFDGLPDLGTNLSAFGVTFTGATVLACGASLNCTGFPPSSGRNVIYDSGGGVITATFDPQEAGRISKVSARITGNRAITMIAYNADNQIVGMKVTPGPNYVGSGTGQPPNILLSIESSLGNIARVTFNDGGNTFTVDDFTFQTAQRVIVIDPGHGLLRDSGGGSHYQRSPSPQFGLIEDKLTLEMALLIAVQLKAEGYTTYLTRLGDNAPFAPVDCKDGDFLNPFGKCIEDLKGRRDFVEQQEADVLVSVHTNGFVRLLGLRDKNGTLALHGPQSNASTLAKDLVLSITALGTTNLGVQAGGEIVLQVPETVSTLVEVAYHNGSTDEVLLNMPSFRRNAAVAMAKAVSKFITDVLDKE